MAQLRRLLEEQSARLEEARREVLEARLARALRQSPPSACVASHFVPGGVSRTTLCCAAASAREGLRREVAGR